MRLMFDCSYPRISYKLFKEYDWFDLYRDENEAITLNTTESRGHKVSIYMYVDADLKGNKSTRRIQTGILIFINKAPIHWYRKSQANIEARNFGEEFCVMKAGVEMIEDLRYKLKMSGVPIYGSSNVFCDNEAIYKNTTAP